MTLKTTAVVLQQPQQLALSQLELSEPSAQDLVVDVEWSGISSGTERLLWSGRIPPFPGMGYPLVPGYESVGRVRSVGAEAGNKHRTGARVFVPGARCFGPVRGLFGGAAATLVVAGERAVPLADSLVELDEQSVLLALAATARHALAADAARPPELIVGHGVLGRLLARLTLAAGHPAPLVWEREAARRPSAENGGGEDGYRVVHPDADPCRDYRCIYDVSGDAELLDTLIARLAPGGEIVLAGFYSAPLRFSFPPAFIREARLRVAAEWRPADLEAVQFLVEAGRLRLGGLITHRRDARQAEAAYRTAFDDPHCLKMILDWRSCR